MQAGSAQENRTEHSCVAIVRGATPSRSRADRPGRDCSLARHLRKATATTNPMTRLVIDPDAQDRASTRELRNEAAADETLRFDAVGRTQELDDEVAEAYADAYDTLLFESEVSEADLDPVGVMLVGTVADVEAALADGEFDDRLSDVETREEEGDARKTVFEAVERRRDAIDDADPDGDQEADADGGAPEIPEADAEGEAEAGDEGEGGWGASSE